MRNLLLSLAKHLDFRSDAESMWFARQLEQELAREYDKEFPAFRMANGDYLPFDNEVDTGAETYVYYTYEPIGIAKILNTYADKDIPMVRIAGKANTGNTVAQAIGMEWDIQQIRRAAFAKKDITTRHKNACKLGHVQVWENLCWVGSAAHGIFGLLTHPNITHTFAPLNAGATSTLWANKTFEEVIKDFATLINTPSNLTNKIEVVDTVILPSNAWADLNARSVSASNGSNISIAGWLQATYKNVTFLDDPFLQAENHADTEFAGKAIAVAYKKDPDKVSIVMPQDFEILEPEKRDLMIRSMTHSRHGGVLLTAPLSVHVLHSF